LRRGKVENDQGKNGGKKVKKLNTLTKNQGELKEPEEGLDKSRPWTYPRPGTLPRKWRDEIEYNAWGGKQKKKSLSKKKKTRLLKCMKILPLSTFYGPRKPVSSRGRLLRTPGGKGRGQYRASILSRLPTCRGVPERGADQQESTGWQHRRACAGKKVSCR